MTTSVSIVVMLEWLKSWSQSSLSLKGYYGSAGGDFYSGFRDSAGTLTQINYPLRNEHAGAMAQYDVEVNDAFSLTGGLHLYRFWRRNWETVMPEDESPYYDDRTVKDEISAFVKGRYDLDRLRLFADVQVRGVRMTFTPDSRTILPSVDIPNHDWLFVNPRVGATFFLNQQSNVYASIGRTGREPTRFDLLGSTQISGANIDVLLNPGTVKPEYATDIELGYRVTTSAVDLNVNAFHMMFDNEIAPIGQYIEQQFVQLRKNVPNSTRTGLEVDGAVRFLGHFTARLNATYMMANIDRYEPENIGVDTVYTDVTPVLTPDLMAQIGLTYTPITGLDFTVNGRYVSEQFLELTNDPSLVLDPFFVMDASASWLTPIGHRVVLNVYNITDQFYATNGATGSFDGQTVPTIFVQAPLSFALMVELNF